MSATAAEGGGAFAPRLPPSAGWSLAGALCLAVGAAVLLNRHPEPGFGRVAAAVNVITLAAAFGAVSRALTGSALGFALSGQNRYSLSRAQVTAWTIVVFGTLLGFAEWNLIAHPGEALSIDIPNPVLAMLGISIFAAVAAPAITSVKAQATQATDDQLATAKARSAVAGQPEPTLRAVGPVVANEHPSNASWRDLFTGDDVSVAGLVDISKLQQAALTVIILAIYFAMAMRSFNSGKAISTLPEVGESAAYLLAISNAGYLAYKAVPKAGVTPPAA